MDGMQQLQSDFQELQCDIDDYLGERISTLAQITKDTADVVAKIKDHIEVLEGCVLFQEQKIEELREEIGSTRRIAQLIRKG